MELERQQRVEEPSPVSQRGSERLFFYRDCQAVSTEGQL